MRKLMRRVHGVDGGAATWSIEQGSRRDWVRRSGIDDGVRDWALVIEKWDRRFKERKGVVVYDCQQRRRRLSRETHSGFNGEDSSVL
ncbi:hypothetical protein M0R45_026472 [Rubus argutus]|uniref:MHC class I antigen n=1 Tax=Rubus argutus TaxID=59490 RepID=A0AAW1X186_RUBAR